MDLSGRDWSLAQEEAWLAGRQAQAHPWAAAAGQSGTVYLVAALGAEGPSLQPEASRATGAA